MAAAALAQTTNPLDLWKQEAPPPDARIEYGSGPLQFGELRLPAGKGPYPVAILVHGGCWSARLGKLPEGVVSYELLRPMAAALAKAGIATWNVEYRRLGDEGAGWPGTYLDLERAADRLRDLAPRYRLDLARVVAIGHSSGGHLAFWLAARGKLPKTSALYTAKPLTLAGAVSIDGPPDLAADRAIQQYVCGGPVVDRFAGGTPDEVPERYREGSASGLLPLGVPQELILASEHNAQWKELFMRYRAAAEAAGDRIGMPVLEGAGHFDGLNPQSAHWETVLERVRALIAPR